MIVFFPFHIVDVTYYIGLFSDAEPCLHSKNKSHLVRVYNPFNMLLKSVCQYYVEDFASMFIKNTGLLCSFLVESLCGFVIKTMLASQNESEVFPSL